PCGSWPWPSRHREFRSSRRCRFRRCRFRPRRCRCPGSCRCRSLFSLRGLSLIVQCCTEGSEGRLAGQVLGSGVLPELEETSGLARLLVRTRRPILRRGHTPVLIVSLETRGLRLVDSTPA